MRNHPKVIALVVLLALVAGTAGGLLWIHSNYKIESVVQIGQPLPTLSFADLDGQAVDFNHFLGQKLLVVFVELECGFCQEQFEVLEAIYGQAEGRLVIVVVATYDSFLSFDSLPENFSPFQLWIDSQRQLRRKLGVVGVPTLFLLDEYGILQYKKVGYQALDEVQKVIASMEGHLPIQ